MRYLAFLLKSFLLSNRELNLLEPSVNGWLVYVTGGVSSLEELRSIYY